MSKHRFSPLGLFRRFAIPAPKSRRRGSVLKQRPLRFKSLETRALLSVSVTQQSFQTVAFTFQGTFTGQGSNTGLGATATASGSASGNGTTVYTNQDSGTGTVQGSATGSSVVTYPTFQYTQPINGQGSGSFTDDNGTLSGSVVVNGTTEQLTATLDTAQLPFTLSGSVNTVNSGWTVTGSGTGPSPRPRPNLEVTAASLQSDGVHFSYANTGGPLATSNRDAAVTTVGLFWASGTSASDVLGSASSDSVPIYWNQASGQAIATGLSTPLTGTTYLLVIADPNHLVSGSTTSSEVQAIRVAPEFSGLTSPTITYGTATTTFSGAISLVPNGETVSITLDGVTQNATVSGGTFSSTFDTAALGVAGSPYTVTYAYAGDGNLLPVSDASQTLTVTKAMPAFSALSGPTIVYGTVSTTLSGSISLVPDGESVSITLDGVTQDATVAGGTFSSTFNTSALGVAGSPYTITYAYAGDANLESVSDTSQTVTVTKATPVFSALSGPTIVYGTVSTTLSGSISLVPEGESVSITLNGVTQDATVGRRDIFQHLQHRRRWASPVRPTRSPTPTRAMRTSSPSAIRAKP